MSVTEKKLEKNLWHFVEDNKTKAWTLLDKRANYILQKTVRLQMEVWFCQMEGANYMDSYMKQGLGGR